jgi:catechol 2,3-dioxygenase-like lactoylglutathione lyase family enzyme
MKYKSLRPLIRTLQLEETIQFYTQILGFELEAKNEEWGWASLISDDIELMIALPNAHEPLKNLILQEVFISILKMSKSSGYR